MKLELRHLRIVCAIADAGSVTKAAARLGLAQPALAAQLKRIERSLGGALFDRGPHGAMPTALGELVLNRARLLLPAVQGLEDEAARLAGNGTHGPPHRIGAVNGPMLSGLVCRLTDDDPHAGLSIHVSWEATELAEMLAAGRLDYALVGVCGDAAPPSAQVTGLPGAERELTWRLLAVDPVFVLLPEQHPLASKPEIDLGDLAGCAWVMNRGDGCFGDCFAAACARAGFAVRQLYEGDVRTCVELVEAGSAVAACQASFRPPPGLVSVPLAGVPLQWRHFFGCLPDAPAAHCADRIAQYAVEAYQDAVARNPRYAQWLACQPRFGLSARSSAVGGSAI